jgi:hypothetical protein
MLLLQFFLALLITRSVTRPHKGFEEDSSGANSGFTGDFSPSL